MHDDNYKQRRQTPNKMYTFVILKHSPSNKNGTNLISIAYVTNLLKNAVIDFLVRLFADVFFVCKI